MGVVYWSGLNGPWLLDDYTSIHPLFINKNYLWNSLLQLLTENQSGPLGRPIASLSFALTYIIHGEAAWGFKFDNLLIHLFCGVLVYQLSKCLYLHVTSRPAARQSQSLYVLYDSEMFALVVSLLWVLHPLQVSTVLYSVQRMTQLSALFSLLAVLVYLRGRECYQSQVLKAKFLLLLFFPLACVLAVLSKETGVLIPVYLIIVESCIYRWRYSDTSHRTFWLAYWGMIFIIPILLVLIFFAFNSNLLLNYSLRSFTLTERLFTQVYVLNQYLSAILMPDLSWMSLLHDDVEIIRKFDLSLLVQIAIILFCVTGALLVKKRLALLAFGILWFYGSHLLESTVFPLELVFEHRNYIGVYGIALAVTFLLWQLRTPAVKALCVVCIVCVLSALTVFRVDTWSDEDKLLTTSYMHHPQSKRSRLYYADVLVKQGQRETAIKHLYEWFNEENAEIGYLLHILVIQCRLNAGVDNVLLEQIKQVIKFAVIDDYVATALSTLNSSLRLNACPNYTPVQHGELFDSVVQRALDLQLGDKFRLSNLYNLRAQAYFLTGDYLLSGKAYDQAYAISDNTGFLKQKAFTYMDAKMFDEARDVLKTLWQLNEKNGIPRAEILQRMEAVLKECEDLK